METRTIVAISGGICLAVIGIVLFVTLLAVSIVDVQNDEYALVYHTISKDFDREQKPLEQGRYTLQPAEVIYTYKRTFQLITMQGDSAVRCVSKDGLLVSLDITWQYRIKKEELVNLMSLLGQDYQHVLDEQTTGAIQNACSNYTSNDFYFSRQQVQNEMSQRVDENLASVFCDGGYLQLVNVRFDPTFNTAIQLTQQAIQDVNQAENERPQTIIQAQTKVLQAQQFAAFTLANSRATAEVILANALYDAEAINVTLAAQLQAYRSISTDLNLAQQALINYISTQTIENARRAVVRVDAPAKFSFA